jgi:hypothetical protein
MYSMPYRRGRRTGDIHPIDPTPLDQLAALSALTGGRRVLPATSSRACSQGAA